MGKRYLALGLDLLFGLTLVLAMPHTTHHLGRKASHCPLLTWNLQASTDLPVPVQVAHPLSTLLPARVVPTGRIPHPCTCRPLTRSPPLPQPTSS